MTKQELISALTELHKRFELTVWSTPLDLAKLRRMLTTKLLKEDASAWAEPIVLPDFDAAPVWQAAEHALANIDVLNDELQQVVLDDIESIKTQLKALESRDDDAVSDWSREQNGLPDNGVIEAAKKIISLELPKPEPKTENAAAVIQAMQEALNFFQLSDWKIDQVTNNSAKASVLDTKKLVKIRDDILLSVKDKERLVVHEIGGHVLRWVNARNQPEPLASFSLGATVATEEGLAVLGEEEHGYQDLATLRTYAIRVLGVDAGQRMGLVDLAFYLNQFLEAEKAAELAFRLRRGLSDPKSFGGWTKDHGYLSGLLRLRELPTADISLLRGVKWPMEALPLIRKLHAEEKLQHPKIRFGD